MPGIVRKSIIFATTDGLVLQPHGGKEPNQSLRIEFESRLVGANARVQPEIFKQRPHLESHGIIGVLTIASFSFLLCITRREQVAQIFGKPIYMIKDIAILPVSSRAEAEQAITQTQAELQKVKRPKEDDVAASTSEESGNESFDERSIEDPSEPQTPTHERLHKAAQSESTTNVVQDVIQRKGYGQFASQWFSRRGWGVGNKPAGGSSTDLATAAEKKVEKSQPRAAESTLENDPPLVVLEAPQQDNSEADTASPQRSSNEAAGQMLPKILRTAKLLFISQSFYFSYDFNITKRFGSSSMDSLNSVSPEGFEPLYFWNKQLAVPFSQAGFSSAIMPIMQGFIGQQPFVVKDRTKETHTEAYKSLEAALKAGQLDSQADKPGHGSTSSQSFLLTLISRRSMKRSGLRYLRRGIDDEGNCANSVETEQILSSPTWDGTAAIRSFVQIRGSIPLYFSQSPYAFKPVPVIHQSPEINRKAFDRHFEELQRRYRLVYVVVLVDKQGGEKRIGEEYENLVKSSGKTGGLGEVGFNWFDFHTECRGMKFENVQRLVSAMEDTINSFGETVIHGQATEQTQAGVIRTNCMDCLDRTNVVQSAFAQYMLQKDLSGDGLEIDFVHDASTQWFNTLWADNGDAISRQYASTAALKGDYTRTRKRDYRGALNDLGLTLTRYYNNIVNDYFSQTVIDVLLGNVTERVFDDFKATMMSADPGISIDKIRQNAIDTCSKIVIEHPEEDLIHGWAVLTPAQTNTLRTLPFDEAILLLTDRAIYGCKFEWGTEKVASFEKIDLRSVTKVRYGTYITSTLTEGQMDEEVNVGLVIVYTPGKESIKRVNTRSLQVSADDHEAKDKTEGNEETTILSWLRARNSGTSQYMAVKMIPDPRLATEKTGSSPIAMAERVCTDIQRAIVDSIGLGEEYETDLVEKADIISLVDARSRTGYLEQIGHSIKKLVWT